MSSGSGTHHGPPPAKGSGNSGGVGTASEGTKRSATENTSSLHQASGSLSSSEAKKPPPPPPTTTLFSSTDPEKISLNPKDYDKPFPYFRRPHILGSFSVDGARKFHHNRHQLMFFHESNLKDPKSFSNAYKRVRLDLNVGLDNAIPKPRSARYEKLDHLLRWILLNKDSFKITLPSSPTGEKNGGGGGGDTTEKFDSLSTDFVCFRGLLTTLMCTPYERREGWEIVAIRFRGTIYLCALETDQKRMAEENMTRRQKNMASWGYKFEQYILSPSISAADAPDILEKEIAEPVNESEEFCCLFRSRLTGYSVVYGAEMDGFRTKSERSCEDSRDALDLNNDGCFIELKTSRVIDNKRLSNSFAQYKTLKWWAQSFLVAIPKILCGFRDDDGVVTQLEDYPIKVLPNMGRNWMPNVCMNFLKHILSFIHTTVSPKFPSTDDGNELVMFNFTWDPRIGKIRCEKQHYLSQNILPDWYTSKIFATES